VLMLERQRVTQKVRSVGCRLLELADLKPGIVLAGNPVIVTVHFCIWAVSYKENGLLSRIHLATMLAAIAFETMIFQTR